MVRVPVVAKLVRDNVVNTSPGLLDQLCIQRQRPFSRQTAPTFCKPAHLQAHGWCGLQQWMMQALLQPPAQLDFRLGVIPTRQDCGYSSAVCGVGNMDLQLRGIRIRWMARGCLYAFPQGCHR